ncbi:MAG: hypothetical protein DCE92_13835 [Alphaproteobacteria bacterium]|nr:MAG: hypothetical protein DCE92_13835 [Alphaproteobacteria bacterium]
MTTASPLACYGALREARYASGEATAQELHHVQGHDPDASQHGPQRTFIQEIPLPRPLLDGVQFRRPSTPREDESPLPCLKLGSRGHPNGRRVGAETAKGRPAAEMPLDVL